MMESCWMDTTRPRTYKICMFACWLIDAYHHVITYCMFVCVVIRGAPINAPTFLFARLFAWCLLFDDTHHVVIRACHSVSQSN